MAQTFAALLLWYRRLSLTNVDPGTDKRSQCIETTLRQKSAVTPPGTNYVVVNIGGVWNSPF